MIERCGYDELSNRWTEFLRLDDFLLTPGLERAQSHPFVTLVIADSAHASDGSLHRFALLLLRAGAVHINAVGRAAERLRRVFEDAVLMTETCSEESHVILTESHGEDVVGALEFVLFDAQPSSAYLDRCSSTLVVLVGESCEEAWLRAELSDPAEFRARVRWHVCS